jgi:UPF0271 protein
MNRQIDINCDLGEGYAHDEELMPFIDSANIACGYHAGDPATMKKTIEMCIKYKVSVGAHPSYFDRKNFGRSELDLPAAEIYELITQQLILLKEIADQVDAPFIHVKPHGALYNKAAADPVVARAIAAAVKDFNHELTVTGLSGSHLINEAKKAGLKSISEVFADRSYQDDGSLTPRNIKGAMIENEEEAIKQCLQLIHENSVTSLSGKIVPVTAETICIHGDGPHAVRFAKLLHAAINED